MEYADLRHTVSRNSPQGYFKVLGMRWVGVVYLLSYQQVYSQCFLAICSDAENLAMLFEIPKSDFSFRFRTENLEESLTGMI